MSWGRKRGFWEIASDKMETWRGVKWEMDLGDGREWEGDAEEKWRKKQAGTEGEVTNHMADTG